MACKELPVINISVAGPSGVGKTTIIATIMRDTTKALPAPFRVNPQTQADKERIARFNRELDAAIYAEDFTFNPNIAGTASITMYNYHIEYKDLVKQPFSIMDVPGGWLLSGNRTNDQWKRYEKHLQESSILWVPIDAPLLMEAKSSDEKRKGVRFRMTTYVRDVVEMWAKYRMTDEHKDEPAFICFTPMKCETYCSKADNPNIQKELFNAFQRGYRETIDNVKEMCPHCTIMYTPVESIGCVKLESMDWRIESSDEPPAITYKVLEPCHQVIAGVEDLIKPVYQRAARQIDMTLESQYNQAKQDQGQKQSDYDKRAFLEKFKDIFGGSQKKRAEIERLAEETKGLKEELDKLCAVLKDLGDRSGTYSKCIYSQEAVNNSARPAQENLNQEMSSAPQKQKSSALSSGSGSGSYGIPLINPASAEKRFCKNCGKPLKGGKWELCQNCYREQKEQEKKGCFITSAVCGSLSKPDGCYELTAFRIFRDAWLAGQDGGTALIERYYTVAPRIVTAINSTPDKEAVYAGIWIEYLSGCLSFIEQGKFTACKERYMEMVTDLEKRYGV